MKLEADRPDVEKTRDRAGGGRRGRRMPSLVRRLLRFAVFLSVLTVLGLGALIFAATSGMGRGQIESLAQRALSQFAGDAMTARFGGASLVFDGINLVGLELLDVRLGDGSG